MEERNKKTAKNGKNNRLPKKDIIDIGSPQLTKIGVAMEEINS